MDIPLPHKVPLFWLKVDKRGPDECWPWTGAPNAYGYGAFRLGGKGSKNAMAHRVAYELEVGPIPEGRQLDHLCRVRLCCNPVHLEPVTVQVNQLRGESPTGINARKTHCPQGHPLSGDNLKIYGGRRNCRACKTAAAAKYRAGLRDFDLN